MIGTLLAIIVVFFLWASGAGAHISDYLDEIGVHPLTKMLISWGIILVLTLFLALVGAILLACS